MKGKTTNTYRGTQQCSVQHKEATNHGCAVPTDTKIMKQPPLVCAVLRAYGTHQTG